ncbi:MAG: DUF2207 domain-containing protein [Actinomycetes bacterium]
MHTPRTSARVRVLAVVVAACLAAIASLGLGLPAQAAAGDGYTQSYDVALRADPNGTLYVKESIQYVFTDFSHGIERYIPNRYPYDDTYDRVLQISDVQVTSPTGAPTDVKVEQQGDALYIRVGDPNQTVTGAQRYIITYFVRGAFNSFSDHDELYWDAIGGEWRTSINEATVEVAAPAINDAICFAGAYRSTNVCEKSTVRKSSASFAQGALPAYTSMTVVVSMPQGAVAVPPPILEARWSLRRAFTADAPHVTIAVALLLLGVAGVAFVAFRRGRDRRFRGQVPGLAPAPGQAAVEERLPWGESAEGPVEWQPPDGLLPGLVGTLIDEQANVLDVTATIVDLAVRGYLRIDELPREGWFTSRDWNLVQLKQPDAELQEYERTLLAAIFKDRGEVKLSALKRTFAADLAKIETQLYDQLVYRRWYNRRPDRTRSSWAMIALVVLAASAGATYLLVRYTTWGLIGAAALVTAGVLAFSGRFMPARTGAGSAVLAQVLGFRRYLETAEANQLKFEEPERVFSRYLPYAIVFGVTDHWAKVFQQLAAAGAVTTGATGLYWYTGPAGWSFGDFGSSISSFAVTSSGSLSAVAASGGSGFGGGGFSGGGFGGGGGGGW